MKLTSGKNLKQVDVVTVTDLVQNFMYTIILVKADLHFVISNCIIIIRRRKKSSSSMIIDVKGNCL